MAVGRFPADCRVLLMGLVAKNSILLIDFAVEMMDQLVTQAIENYVHAGYPVDAAAILLVEVEAGEHQPPPQRMRQRVHIVATSTAISATATITSAM